VLGRRLISLSTIAAAGISYVGTAGVRRSDVRDACCRSLYVLPGRPGGCVEEIVTDSNQSNITFQRCVSQGRWHF